MKKIIKISLLILFIIFVFGITTSNATYTVTEETKPAEMLEALENGNKLTGISGEVRDKNPFLYCIDRNVNIRSDSIYSEGTKYIYPGNYENGHAIAYIFAAPGYEKSDEFYGIPTEADERQWAYYLITGQIEDATSDLYEMALEYQSYKNTETDLILSKDTAKVSVSGGNVVYGPIQIQCSYGSAKRNTHEDEWGGFYYAFFDKNGNNVSNKVKLCTLRNNTYETIESTLNTSNDKNNGYYKVSTDDYNDNKLYVITTDKSIDKLNMKIRTNKVDYTATVTELVGTYNEESSGHWLCDTCKTKGIQVGSYYYSYKTDHQMVYDSNLQSHIVTVNGTIINIGNVEYHHTDNFGDHYYQRRYICQAILPGCGDPQYGPKGSYPCGQKYEKGTNTSQPLYLVEDASRKDEDEIEIPIELPTVIQLTKQWIDYDGKYRERPEITIEVFRSINPNATEYVTDKDDPEKLNKWLKINEESNYKLTWTQKEGNIWTAIIDINAKFVTVGEETKPYYFKIVEEMDEENASYYNVRYYDSNGNQTQVVDLNSSNQIKIINELKSRKIEVTKKWDDYSDKYKLRPPEINITVYRCLDLEGENNWTELTEGSNYTLTWDKPEGSDTWVATIDKLALAEMVEGKKVLYKYKVVEEAPDYYNVTYSNTDGIVDQDTNKLTITNHLKNARLELTKIWDDGGKNRPETIDIIVYRSLDRINWTKLSPKTDNNLQGNYTITWNKTDDPNKWTAVIDELALKGKKADGTYEQYYYKIEENAPGYYNVSYSNEDGIVDRETHKITITNKMTLINISGYVWLDGQKGIKPARENNGIMDTNETKMKNIVVKLYTKNNTLVATTKTNKDGYYKFKDYPHGYYYVEFEYDGIRYEDTIEVENGSSKAFEEKTQRDTFNNKFSTITYDESANGVIGKSNGGIVLDYNYSDGKSTLITNIKGTAEIQDVYKMTAKTKMEEYKDDVQNLNFGLVKRGMDIALSTDVSNAKVTINGESKDYPFNNGKDLKLELNEETGEMIIGSAPTVNSAGAKYNLNLYTSDYNYRIRDYITNEAFKEKDYINNEIPSGTKTGDELKVYVTYELNLQNQSTETIKINEVEYVHDGKYTFKEFVGENYTYTANGNTLSINLNGLQLTEGHTKTLYLVFEVNNNDGLATGEFLNKAEITSYSTAEGLVDVDSEPGNFIKFGQVEDDSDTAGGLTIKIAENTERKITGKVFDGSNNVNDVIVQLIELKTVNGNVYEYIWQETVSGTGKGLRLNADGSALEDYTYTPEDEKQYEFRGFIPGDYMVRFIYGDGTTYDMTNNVIKYNGQDYKSVVDRNYNAEWYNSSSYAAGQSVARDNEARRLETMAYSVEIDAVKGVLLKLLNNVTIDDLNETEKEILVVKYNNLYDPDITAVTAETIAKLLKDEVLKNTWMCAETSKIKVAVDNSAYENINLGLEKRPETKIELKKYITGFKLVASNGQTLVNANVDVNEYLNGTMDSNKVQGVKDYVTILNNVWQYEVVPTDINTIIDGANLEFEYTLVVKNTSADDYLSETLAKEYHDKNIENYKDFLNNKVNGKVKEIKDAIRKDGYNKEIGKYLGQSYYTGGTAGTKVSTQVTSIRDYVNNNLDFISGTKPDGTVIDLNSCSDINHRILRDDYSMQDISVKYISTGETGKMDNAGNTELYTITLGKNPISSTGNLEFDTYIAEVMSYTNAAGRRSITSTPGNAEIIDSEKREGRTHEIDEADTGRIQIGVATGEDNNTNYIIITTVIAGIAIIAAGAFVVKKYVIK